MAKPGFHRGSSGSPFHTEYYGDAGIETGPGGKPSEEMPRIGSGVLGRRVSMEVNRGSGRGRAMARRESSSSAEE